MSEPQTVVITIVALLSAALVVSVKAERVGVPYVVALLLIAGPVQIPNTQNHFGPALIFVFLPSLIFEAAWNVDAASLRRNWLAVSVLAIPGVIVTAFLVAGGWRSWGCCRSCRLYCSARSWPQPIRSR